MSRQNQLRVGALRRSGLKTSVTVLALGLFVFALGARLSWYLPENDLAHYLSSAGKMSDQRHDKVVTALAAEFVETLFLEDAPTGLNLPRSDSNSPKSTPVLLPHQFRSPPVA